MAELSELVICPQHGIIHHANFRCYLCKRRSQINEQINLAEYDRKAQKDKE